MSNQPKGTKGFQWYSKSWYYPYTKDDTPDKGDSISIDIPGINGEIIIREKWLSDNELNGIQYTAYDDSWELLARCIEIIPALAQLENQTLEAVAEMLTGLGYRDLTEKVRPE